MCTNPVFYFLFFLFQTYSGTFKHILSRLALIEEILKLMGYEPRDGYYKLPKSAISSLAEGKTNLSNLLHDLILAGLLCEIMDDMYGSESVENMKLMCKIRVNPAYLEHEEANNASSNDYVNGASERANSQSNRVKFIDNEVESSYPMGKPSKSRSSKTTTEIAWADSTLARPRPRSILRQSVSSGTTLAAPSRSESDGVRKSTVPESYSSPKETKKKSPENKTSGGRYLPSPPTHQNSNLSYIRALPPLLGTSDFQESNDFSNMRFKASNNVPVDGINQFHYTNSPVFLNDDSEVRLRSRDRLPNNQNSVSHRFSSNDTTSRRQRQQSLSHRSSTGNGYKR